MSTTNYSENQSQTRKHTILGAVALGHVLVLAACSTADQQVAQNAETKEVVERVTSVGIEAPAEEASADYAPAPGAPAPPAPPPPPPALVMASPQAEAIAVTGTRRAQTLQEVPVSVMPVRTAVDPGRERYEGEEVSNVKLTQAEPVSTFS
ncbi:MAG: hypothetical protein HRT64_15150, partial [Erythrobacter sp.]|nr:hypothetical protein [Erythrobacter sp.]